ncbi:hypothetical protein Q5P01_022629 [Channa striata]|uniref:VWFC domain-containing protein n=1 Tax=Channa striata TaxID=64152 RepID=A0AA88IYY4_CHASR|nr:hypothetical protein Q5P01_022629 [Channa striata]
MTEKVTAVPHTRTVRTSTHFDASNKRRDTGVGLMSKALPQLFEDCSKKQPCDHTKGLECNFGGGFAAKGVCRAKSDGRTCEYNNKIYQNGEIFRPNCKHQCTCMDGAVGCVSLCPRQLSLPKTNCAKPERVKVRRQCCEQLICAEKREPESSVVKKHRKHRGSQDDLSKNSNLVLLWRERAKSLPAFGSHPVGHTIARGVTCVSLTSAWSPCSKSCGTGMSKRMSNNNSKCKLVAETRMCEVRPCDQRAFSSLKNITHPHNGDEDESCECNYNCSPVSQRLLNDMDGDTNAKIL